MTYIREMRLRNWRCFEGEQTLGFDARTYAVVARDAVNIERSNWLGKSSFLDAIRFAMTGQVGQGETVESWITRGEDEGGVDLELADGTYVSRGRQRGISTQLLVVRPDGIELTKDQAQEYLERVYCRVVNWDTSVHVGQNETARFIDMDPAQRSEMFATWGKFDRLYEELEVVEESLFEAQRVFTDITTAVARIPEIEREIEVVKEELASAETVLADANSKYFLEVAKQEAKKTRDADRAARERYEAAKEFIAGPSPSVIAPVEIAEALRELHERQARVNDTKTRLNLVSSLARGDFVGECPLDHKPCPRTDDINADAARHRLEQQALKTCLEERRGEEMDAGDDYSALLEKKNERVRYEVRLANEKRIVEEWEAYRGTKATSELDEVFDVETTRKAVEVANSGVAVVEAKLNVLRGELDQCIASRMQLPEVGGRVERLRAFVRLYGRNGAQLEIAKSIMESIGGRANGALRRAGVDLEVSMSWGRELKRLENACPGCGHAYGKSQRAKACPVCQEVRRPAVQPSASVHILRNSGGARDIAGLVLQLAVARWLRSNQQTSWGTYLVDEPFGAVDRANRKALSAQLASLMWEEFGATQAFVVAHDNDTLEALPGAVVIESQDGRARARVIA